MANELEILTENADGDSWVDASPSAISTGYQAQNTNITARTVGQDLSSVYIDGTDIMVEISGPIDVDGLPFYVTEEITLTSTGDDVQYIQVVDGSTSTQKSLSMTATEPTWEESKNAFYNGDNRVLNWVIVVDDTLGTLAVKLTPSHDEGGLCGDISGALITPTIKTQTVRGYLDSTAYAIRRIARTGTTTSSSYITSNCFYFATNASQNSVYETLTDFVPEGGSVGALGNYGDDAVIAIRSSSSANVIYLIGYDGSDLATMTDNTYTDIGVIFKVEIIS